MAHPRDLQAVMPLQKRGRRQCPSRSMAVCVDWPRGSFSQIAYGTMGQIFAVRKEMGRFLDGEVVGRGNVA